MSDWDKLTENGGVKRGEIRVILVSEGSGKSIFEAAYTYLGVDRSNEPSKGFKMYKLNPETDKYELVSVKPYQGS